MRTRSCRDSLLLGTRIMCVSLLSRAQRLRRGSFFFSGRGVQNTKSQGGTLVDSDMPIGWTGCILGIQRQPYRSNPVTGQVGNRTKLEEVLTGNRVSQLSPYGSKKRREQKRESRNGAKCTIPNRYECTRTKCSSKMRPVYIHTAVDNRTEENNFMCVLKHSPRTDHVLPYVWCFVNLLGTCSEPKQISLYEVWTVVLLG